MTNPTYVRDSSSVPKTTLPGLFFESVARHGDAAAFGRITPSLAVEDVSFNDAFQQVRHASGGLLAYGLNPGDRVCIMSENRLEWALADLACLCSGVVDIPIYPALKAPQVAFILKDSGAKLVFVSTAEHLAKVVEARSQCGHSVDIVVFAPPDTLPERTRTWADYMRQGAEASARIPVESFRRRALQATPEDVATILYTSGTTGESKGVMLTHGNVTSNALAVGQVVKVGPGDSTLSFLPLTHIFQRMVDFMLLASGCQVVHGRAISTAMEDMRIVKPTIVLAVPRVYEKMYQALHQRRGLSGRLLAWGTSVADRAADSRLAGKRPGGLLGLQYLIADRFVFAKIRAVVGGRVRWFVSGSAPLSATLNRFFYSIGFTILEGYGLTETSPAVAVNTAEAFRIGTVGKVIPGTELRIAQDGEILVRGPQVMKGYYNRPDDTAQALDAEGWFHTGDIGELDEDGFLRITDRKKDLLKTSGGKYVAPAVIENRLKECVLVEQSVMVGDARKFVVLLLVPSFKALEAWAAERNITWKTRGDLIADERVKAHMETEVGKYFHGLASYETPKKIGLIPEELTIENGFLTPSLKLKRRVVQERFKDLIDQLYQEAAEEHAGGAE
jgi:long-chain acyl-CoA synthetase